MEKAKVTHIQRKYQRAKNSRGSKKKWRHTEGEWLEGLPRGEGADADALRLLLKDCLGPHMHRHGKTPTPIAETEGRGAGRVTGGRGAHPLASRHRLSAEDERASDLSAKGRV